MRSARRKRVPVAVPPSLQALAREAFHDHSQEARAVYDDLQEELGVPRLHPSEELGLMHPRRPQTHKKADRVANKIAERRPGPDLTDEERASLRASLHNWRDAIGACYAPDCASCTASTRAPSTQGQLNGERQRR